MRILTVCVSTSVFGAEVVTLKMLEGFKRVGHEQIAVTSVWTDGEFSRRLRQISIAEIRMPFGFLAMSFAIRPMWWTIKVAARFPQLWFKWFKLRDAFRADIVLFTSWRHVLAVYPLVSRRNSFLIEHSAPARTVLRRLLYRLLRGKIVGFITVSQSLRHQLIDFGVPAEQLHVVQNGVFSLSDASRVAEATKGWKPRSAKFVRLAIIGQIAPNKGHSCLVDSINALKPNQAAVKVFIFGTGDEEYTRRLKQRIDELGLGEVFLWMGYESDQTKIYEASDVVVVPSLFEDPFPTVAMEAGAYYRPVIASRIGGLPEIIEDGITGWLFQPGDSSHLAKIVEACLAHPEVLAEMGKAAHARIFSQFTQERMVAGLESVFAETVSPLTRRSPSLTAQ